MPSAHAATSSSVDAYVARLAAEAPPLTPEQAATIRAAFRGARPVRRRRREAA